MINRLCFMAAEILSLYMMPENRGYAGPAVYFYHGIYAVCIARINICHRQLANVYSCVLFVIIFLGYKSKFCK